MGGGVRDTFGIDGMGWDGMGWDEMEIIVVVMVGIVLGMTKRCIWLIGGV